MKLTKKEKEQALRLKMIELVINKNGINTESDANVKEAKKYVEFVTKK